MLMHLNSTTRHHQAIARAAATLRFPLIVKHPRGYGSIGMDLAAKVGDQEALAIRVHTAIAAWGCALVEEFVAGREATVLVVSSSNDDTPHALVPVECVFAGAPNPGSFKDFDTKFGAGRIEWRAMDAHEDAALAAALRDASVKVPPCWTRQVAPACCGGTRCCGTNMVSFFLTYSCKNPTS